MTNNIDGDLPQESASSEIEEYRRLITARERVLDTSLPGIFTVKVLLEYGELINGAINAIRNAKEQLGENVEIVLEHLRNARDAMQLAMDEPNTASGRRRHYRCIRSASKELRSALASW